VLGIPFDEMVVQLILLILTILFFVSICLFLLNYMIRGIKRKNEMNKINLKLDQLKKEKDREDIK
jgi:predicted Holliday junction resolvase-like endonuclease